MHKSLKISFYFGSNQDSMSVDQIRLQQKSASVIDIEKKLKVTQTVFLYQEHGVQGLCLDQADDADYFFNRAGDYIFTKKIKTGIGVVTADCLPIIIYDTLHHAVAIVHAGWKGLAAGIFQITLQAMIEQIGTNFKEIEIYLGPAAGVCCYEVQQDFIDKFTEYKADFIIFFDKKGDKTYFNSRLFMMVSARNLGISQEKIYTRYNVCTICNLSFCSYRREKEKARRQISMVCLH